MHPLPRKTEQGVEIQSFRSSSPKGGYLKLDSSLVEYGVGRPASLDGPGPSPRFLVARSRCACPGAITTVKFGDGTGERHAG